MALNLPSSAEEVVRRAKTDVQRELVNSNPFLKNSVLGAIVTGYGNRIFDTYVQIDELTNVLILDTTVAEFLERWAAIFGKTRLPATQSTGNVVAAGTPGTDIPIGTVIASSDSVLYDSTATVTIVTNILSCTITLSGQIATVITPTPHNLSDNVIPTIAGANEVEYNGAQIVNIIDDDTFQYTVIGSPGTPATGAITVTFDSVLVPVQSQDFQDSNSGVEVNQDAGSLLTLQSPIAGVNSTVGVDAGAIGGGTDQESDEDLRNRTLGRVQNPVAHFNVSDITDKAKEVAGVTRVFVFEVTPALGQVTIYFMRDNDQDPIPTASEVTTVKNKILEIKPANTADVDVIVLAPIPDIRNFIFSSLTPNTSTMQTAVNNNLIQFFAEETEVEVNIDQDAYRAAIQNTTDPQTGDRVQDFVLSTPVGDIIIAPGNIGVLGTVTYP